MFKRRRPWPTLAHEEIIRRARILVIDDQDFPYRKLFQRDGYTVEKWNDVRSLADLEGVKFDLILLDLLGVGRKESSDEGLGLLKHIRTASPAQIVVAYSNAEWPVSSQPFFDMADAVLPKTADYAEFKRTVDRLLDQCFSLGFYVSRIQREVGDRVVDVPKLTQTATESILSESPSVLRKYLIRHLDDPALVDRVLSIASVAITICTAWKT